MYKKTEKMMNNNKISVIVFDLGNVLIPFNYDIAFNNLDNVEAGLGKNFKQYYKDNYSFHRSFERGVINNETFVDTMLKALDNKVSAEDFCNWFSHVFTTNNKIIEILPKLKENYKLVLLSNTNGIHQKYGWQQYPFIKYFDKLILSHEVGAVKPEEKIYRAAELYTQKPSSEHLFVDDVKEYAEGARKCGWSAIQFISQEQVLLDLKEFGIKY